MKTMFFLAIAIFSFMSSEPINQQDPSYRTLTKDESRVLIEKGTERAWTGKYTNSKEKGTYVCKQCGAALYRSDDKFDSNCGWPSFDDEIEGSVKKIADPDGQRTEIICATCNAHLGHVFTGEKFTSKNTRHCVNSISLEFIPAKVDAGRYGMAIFAGGCFWGVEYFLQKEPGVISVTSGYTGGTVKNPTYREVCTGRTGHAEAVKIVYDPAKTNYEKLLKLFLEIHDPTQEGGQGPDIGDQYRSEIFYLNNGQKLLAEKYLKILNDKGINSVTKVTAASEFYDAESYHQDYYFLNGKKPYCHSYTKRF